MNSVVSRCVVSRCGATAARAASCRGSKTVQRSNGIRSTFVSYSRTYKRMYNTEAPSAAPADGSAAKPQLSKAEKERLRVEQARKNITVVKPKLGQVLKLELLQNETPENIADIWKKYHKEKYTVASVTSTAVYERIHSKLREYPTFIVPLPKEQGAEFYWMQVQDNLMLFTRLIEYKVRKEQAKPALIVAHYTELAADKDLVLMRGEIDPAVLTPFEAQTLLNQTQAFYLDNKRFEIVKTFNKDPAKFDYETILIDMPIQSRIADVDVDAQNNPHAPNQ